MYKKYFGIRKAPFSIAPDPRYLFMSEQHREALAHLLYGVKNNGGFVLLTGEVGTGKTTICRCLLEQLPKNCDIAYVIHPKISAIELLATICDEFRISYPKRATTKIFLDRINAYLLEAHANRRKALLIIDEAQNLSDEVLEQVRLLTNLETNERKLLQIILIGQPELRDKLARPEMRQLSQRIVARCHLGPLSKAEVAPYVNHRLAVAGIRTELFSPKSLSILFKLSGGIPRIINAICDRALLGAFVQEKKRIEKSTLVKAAVEVLGKPAHSPRRVLMYAAGLVLLAVAVAAAYLAGPIVFANKHQPVGADVKKTAAEPVQALNEAPPAEPKEEKTVEEKAQQENVSTEDLPTEPTQGPTRN